MRKSFFGVGLLVIGLSAGTGCNLTFDPDDVPKPSAEDTPTDGSDAPAACTGIVSLSGLPASTERGNDFVASDLNGDGFTDLIVDSSYPSTGERIVYFGKGDGTFESLLTRITIGEGKIALGDLDKDGEVDLVTFGYSDSSYAVKVRLGNGDGTFQGGKAIGTMGTRNYAPLVADVNLDGWPDIVGGTPSQVSLLINDKDGTFTAAGGTAGGDSPLAVGDLNGDGWPDVVFGASKRFTVFFNDRTGGFPTATPLDLPTSASVGMIALAEAAGGEPAYVIAKTYQELFYVPYSGSFGSPISIETGIGDIKSMGLGDLNNDQRTDLLVNGDNDGATAVVLNHGGGVFVLTQKLELAGRLVYARPSPSDIDKDGDLDIILVAGGEQFSTIYVLPNDGFGKFVPPTLVVDAPFASAAVVGDFNSDNRPDLAVFACPYGASHPDVSTPGLQIHFGGPGRAFSAGSGFALSSEVSDPAALDLDGDGSLDLVGLSGGDVALFLNNAGAFSPPQLLPVGTSLSALATADLDGNGRLDLVVADEESDSVTLLRNNGNGTITSIATTSGCTNPSDITSGDLDGDSDVDVVVTCSYTDTILAIYNAGDGTVEKAIPIATCADPQGIALEDLNGDLRPEAIVACDEIIGVSANDGLGSLSNQPVEYSAPWLGDRLLFADLDLDGTKELLADTANGAQIYVFEVRPNATLSPPKYYLTGQGTVLEAITDMDGDKRPDVVLAASWYHPKGVTILYNSCYQ